MKYRLILRSEFNSHHTEIWSDATNIMIVDENHQQENDMNKLIKYWKNVTKYGPEHKRLLTYTLICYAINTLAVAVAVLVAAKLLNTTEEALKQEFVSTWTDEELSTTDPEWIEYATLESLNRE